MLDLIFMRASVTVYHYRRSVQKMMKRGAKEGMQLEEQLAFKKESESLRLELRKAAVEDVSVSLPLISPEFSVMDLPSF
jgi:hypothetical protein